MRNGYGCGFMTKVILALVAGLSVWGQTDARPQQTQLNAAPGTNSQTLEMPVQRQNYVGDDTCKLCHREKVEIFHQTAHYLTSRLPSRNSILGNFTPGANVLKTSNPELLFRMETKVARFFQTAVEGVPPYTESHTEEFGLVVGSGGKGQTYLYWRGDRLFQLPVSYWRKLGWVNSPGYRDGFVNFQRPIIPRCLECHATYFQAVPHFLNRYVQDNFVMGITCEKCHGPGREHVERESSNPKTPSGPAILNPARFSRERQIDLCAWCHAGHGEAITPPFTYVPGQPLDKYIELPPPDPGAQIDVHGDQVELLRKSRCFQSSAMTCVTCHDVHTPQHDLAALSQHCLSCHKPGTDSFPKMNHQPASNCIDCHMPKQDTNLIVFDWKGNKETPQVRTHWIKIYAGATTAPESPAR